MKSPRKQIDKFPWVQVVKSILERGTDKDAIAVILHGHRIHKKDAKVTDSASEKYSFTSLNKFRSDVLKDYYFSMLQNHPN
jgi:hypothetical protein